MAEMPPTPTPPTIPDWAPGRGNALYRYTVHDLLGGVYRGEIYPINVSFDRRIGEPGTFSCTLPIPNRRTADQIAEIIPRDPADLTTGPGRITVRIWRAGDWWGEYWITGAIIQRSRRGGITIQLRGSTLEAFLDHVPIEEDVTFEGDEIDNARDLLDGLRWVSRADLGLTLSDGTSGVSRTLEAKAEDATTYGDVLKRYAQSYPGFEWVITPRITVDGLERRWEWGAPTLPYAGDHVFVDSPTGGDILDWSEEIDALRGATRIRVRGGTPEVEDASEGSKPVMSDWVSATAHLAAGWPRYGGVMDHPGESISGSELDNYAQRWISTLPGAVRVYSCTVALGARPTISPASLGGWVRRIMINSWYPRRDGGAGFDAAQRLIGIAVTPVSRQSGKEEAQLILEEPHA